MELLIINFGLSGIAESDYRAVCDELAPAFAAVPGLASKVWLADGDTGIYGGVYTFENAAAVDAFLGSELFAGVGAMTTLRDITVRRFGVLAGPAFTARIWRARRSPLRSRQRSDAGRASRSGLGLQLRRREQRR